MESVPFLLDFDEEEEQQQQQQQTGLEEEGEMGKDYDWIKELLDMSDEEQDEVVVLSEVNNPEDKSKSSISTPVVKVVDDDDEEDDDCVVLDGDPEKLVTSVNDSPTGSDELVVVGEKGQIACRDYPHPRHLCVNFPYSSTPHERHCGQCHCYVCDSPAPCLKWGTGISSTDHCHATDKSEMWKTLRENFKLGKTAPLPAPTNYGTLGDVGKSQYNHILPLDSTQLSPNSVLMNQTSRSTATHPRSANLIPQNQAPWPIITNYGTLGDVSNSRHNHILPLDSTRLSPNSVLMNQTSRSTATHPHTVNLRPQNQASRPMIMHTGSSPSSSFQNQVYRPNTVPLCSTPSNFTALHGANHGRCQESGSTLLRNRYHSHSVPRQLLGVSSHAIQKERWRGASSLGPQFLCPSMMSKGVGSVGVGSNLTMNHFTHGAPGFSNYHVNPAWQYEYDRYRAATGFSNSRTCYGQNNDVWVPKNLSYPQPSSELTSLGCVSKYPAAYQTQAYYQSNDNQNLYGYSIRGNDTLSSYVASLDRNQHLNEHQIGSQNENARGNIIGYGATMQDACQKKPHDESQSESARKAGFLAYDSSWAGNTSQNSSYLQSSGAINIPPNAKESGTQFTGSSNLSVDDIKHWLFDEEGTVPVEVDGGALASEQNIPSPDLATIDKTKCLFGYANSWDGLAHV